MKNYVITGATSGIGLACAQKVLANGDSVTVVCRNLDKAQGLFSDFIASGKVKVLCWDFSHNEGLYEYCLTQLKDIRVDGMIYSAGIESSRPLRKTSYHEQMNMIEVNVIGFNEMVRALLKLRKKDQELSILTISSISADTYNILNPFYGVTKAALQHLVKVQAKELACKDLWIPLEKSEDELTLPITAGLMVRVNALALGMVYTNMTIDMLAMRSGYNRRSIAMETIVDTAFGILNNPHMTGQTTIINNNFF